MACIAANTPWINAAFGSGTLPTTGAAAGGAPPGTGGCTGGGATGMGGRAGGCTMTGLAIGTLLAFRPHGITIALVPWIFFTCPNDPVIAHG